MAGPVIEVKNLNLTLQGKSILNKVNLLVNQKQICAFIGENGAGKTSTIRSIIGLYPPTEGQCSVFGQLAYKMNQQTRNRVGVVLDEGGLYSELNAWEHILFFGRIRGLDKLTIAKRFERLTKHFELQSTEPVGRYSKGMKQKLMLIRELLHDPELLILDEPFNGLDPDARILLRDKLKEICTEQGTAVFISSHDLFDIEKIADQVVMIQQGCIIADQRLQDIVGSSEQYIVTTSDPGKTAEAMAAIQGMNVVTHDDRSVTFTVQMDLVPHPLRTLMEHGIKVDEFFKKKHTLEEFYKKTKKSVSHIS
ncbi:ABC-type multidrug transport system ATPase subunit [Paenibacillus sp. DS2015]|uniref:ABC transporter ATP-binding protein n=1 Tax=Paenibacillus sp. DS2015 TaxID=3373917 RepID=UPI003D1E0FA9